MSATVDRQARKRIQALEERASQRDRETAELSARLSRGAADFARLAATVGAIRASGPIPSPAVPSNSRAPPRAPSVSATKSPDARLFLGARKHRLPPLPPQCCRLPPRVLLP
jgi:hypothetical protein